MSMHAARDPDPSQERVAPSLRRAALFGITLLVMLASCTSDPPQLSISDESPTPAAPEFEPTQPPIASPTSAATPAPPLTATPISETPPCVDVPAFSSADTVSIACSGSFAVSPELFASNAGWHLFEASQGVWEEIDYARTCCEANDASFIELLQRNGLDPTAQALLCAATGLANDPFSGCVEGAPRDTPVGFEPTWLRVNGLGEADFGAARTTVLASISNVFGPPSNMFEATECGGGPMTIASFNDFTVQFQDDAFIGWYYSSSNPPLTTPSGVAPGISEADLTVVYAGVSFFDDTLGREFFFEVPAGFMAGFISDTDATVTALYAGTNCFFR